MNYSHTIAFAAALAALPVTAQSLIVVPNGYENLEGTSAARTPLGWSSGRVQYLVDGAQLCQNVAVVTSLQLRLDGGNFNVDAPLAKSFQCTVDAYEVAVTPATMSNDWLSNIGTATPVNVFSGTLDVLAAFRQLPYPNPWAVEIVLDTPLVYARANGNLMLDITVTGGSGDNWPADGFFFHASEARGEVTRIHDDASCSTTSGSLSIDVPQVAGNGVVGGSLQVNHTAMPIGSAALDFVLHVLSTQNRATGGQPLPLALGLLGAPTCLLNLDYQIGELVPTSAGSMTWALPNNPVIVGATVFTQALALDTASGGLVPSQDSWQVRIGPAMPADGPAQMVHRSNYTNQTTGSLSPTGYYGLVMGFVGSFQ
jgi:hypothetical protein